MNTKDIFKLIQKIKSQHFDLINFSQDEIFSIANIFYIQLLQEFTNNFFNTHNASKISLDHKDIKFPDKKNLTHYLQLIAEVDDNNQSIDSFFDVNCWADIYPLVIAYIKINTNQSMYLNSFISLDTSSLFKTLSDYSPNEQCLFLISFLTTTKDFLPQSLVTTLIEKHESCFNDCLEKFLSTKDINKCSKSFETIIKISRPYQNLIISSNISNVHESECLLTKSFETFKEHCTYNNPIDFMLCLIKSNIQDKRCKPYLINYMKNIYMDNSSNILQDVLDSTLILNFNDVNNSTELNIKFNSKHFVLLLDLFSHQYYDVENYKLIKILQEHSEDNDISFTVHLSQEYKNIDIIKEGLSHTFTTLYESNTIFDNYVTKFEKDSLSLISNVTFNRQLNDKLKYLISDFFYNKIFEIYNPLSKEMHDNLLEKFILNFVSESSSTYKPNKKNPLKF